LQQCPLFKQFFKKRRLHATPAKWDDILMEITDQDVKSFVKLYKEKYDETLSAPEAVRQASTLIRYVRLCQTPGAEICRNGIMARSNESE